MAHPPIDPESPLPEPCDPANARAQPSEKDMTQGPKLPSKHSARSSGLAHDEI